MNLRSNMKKLMIFMSAALLLSSCGLYNKYERPEVDTKGLVRDTQSLTGAVCLPIHSCRLLSSRDLTIILTC